MTLLGANHGFLEVTPHDPMERRADREVILLLHGLGGNKSDWDYPQWRSYHWDHNSTPSDKHSNNHWTPPLYPPIIPRKFSLSNFRDNVRCWSGTLRALGHTIINYNQDGPQKRVEVPLTQLEDLIVPFIRNEVLVGPLANKRVIVLCHSRGGILARAYIGKHLNEATEWISKVITLCSPHQGTLAPLAKEKLVNALSGVLGLFNPVLGIAIAAISRIANLVSESDGANQLLPGNPIFDELVDPIEIPEIEFFTYGGKSVRYSRVYHWLYRPDSYVPNIFDFPDVRFDWTLVPIEIPIISPIMESFPDAVVDDEQDENEGDGLVSDQNARLPGAPHSSLSINHIEALFNEDLFTSVAQLLGTPLTSDITVECSRSYIGNRRSRELHDPLRETPNCQLDEIIDRWPFSSAEDAFDMGYDGCAYCMGQFHTR